ncbi:hypothetical protein BACUNI_02262 [Bacteroides uniformis ATCC 8492]|uniref:Uncharacterized protein n=1 Tax=Bacteroides uniformis (strain ATCC 8492 / DSM 6597 / CCUG 4942 / CIP 103695 / JCM 5828 / KCTC 5204 / NCTC 13054 / VPI 0061) TaxID=411479 RepID=A0ABC9NBS3_BACUC|nr:hypothetical protein BACUNI_02262 [Bacteroides uniformis ATCC 8492]
MEREKQIENVKRKCQRHMTRKAEKCQSLNLWQISP